MKKKEWYVIKDFEEFVNTTRALVFNLFGKQRDDAYLDIGLDSIKEEEREEFDSILSYAESDLIAKEFLRKQINKKTGSERYLLSERSYIDLINALNHRMVGNLLHRLVNKGLVETSFDEEANDFVFWLKDDNKENENKPETD